MRKTARNILEGIFAAAATFLLFSSLIFTIPKLWGLDTYVVTSGSMEPTISKGSVVFVDTKDRTPEYPMYAKNKTHASGKTAICTSDPIPFTLRACGVCGSFDGGNGMLSKNVPKKAIRHAAAVKAKSSV